MRYHEFLLEYDRAKAMAGFGGKLQARLQADSRNKDLSLEQLFAKLEQADPSPNKQYVNWMARAYQNGSELEDIISRGADSLAKLDQLKLKKQIKPEHSDVGKFKTLPELETVLNQYQLSEPEQKIDRGNYIEIVKNSNVRIIQLLDETAARYYGKGTTWCTAAKRNNMFKYYISSGPLFVFIPAKPLYSGEKYQFWFAPEELQLMDERDSPVRLSEFKRRFPEIYLLGNKVKPTPIFLRKNPSEEELKHVIERNGAMIQYVDNPSDELQMAAIKSTSDGFYLYHIKHPSERVQLFAVKHNGYSIRILENPSEEVQLAAVNATPFAIEYIENPSLAVQLAAIQKDPRVVDYINNPNPFVLRKAYNEISRQYR